LMHGKNLLETAHSAPGARSVASVVKAKGGKRFIRNERASLGAQPCPAMRNRPGHPKAARPVIAPLKRALLREVRTSSVPVRQRRAQLGAILQRPTLGLGVACRFDDTPPVVDTGNPAI